MVRRVRRIIGQLFSVLSLVRRPTSLGANEKVLNYDFASKLGHDYQELLGTLPDYLDSWLKQNFKSVSDSQQCTLPQFLFDRLKQAAIFRRKAWLLRSRHKRKLHGDVAARFDRVPFRQTITIQQNPASVASHDRADAKTIARGEAGSKILSGTVPSITPEQIRLRQTKVTAQPTPKSSKSVIQQRGRLDVPFPPKRAAPAMEFDCYICGLTLDKVEAQEDRWKYV